MTGPRHWFTGLCRRMLPHDQRVVPARFLFDWQKGHPGIERVPTPPPPAVLQARLREDDPELVALRHRYAACDPRVTQTAVWAPGVLCAADLAAFRGDNAYVWQDRGSAWSINAYALTTWYLRARECALTGAVADGAGPGLFGRLTEDAGFGALAYDIGGSLVSRDLLDSMSELRFLDRHLDLGGGGIRAILDVGAGYGRFAHRAATAFPTLERVLCSDAIPESSYLCGLYLAYRSSEGRAEAVPLDQIEARLDAEPVDLAVNRHSFSECQPPAIAWWLDLLSRRRVRWLMIVPNAMDHGGARLLTGTGFDFAPLVTARGYRHRVSEPKYADPVVQRYGLAPTMYHLFELPDT